VRIRGNPASDLFLFAEPKTAREGKKSKKRLLKESNQTRLSPFLLKTGKKIDDSLDEMFNASLTLTEDQTVDEADLSAIVLGIVGPDAYYQDLSPESGVESAAPTNCGNSDSSEHEYQTCVPLLERIKKKGRSARVQEFCSPEHKKMRAGEPYSPLLQQPSFDAPPPRENGSSVSLAKAVRRFSVSLQAFSSPSAPVTSSPPSSSSSSPDSRFDLGVTQFLNSLDD